jgi:hypothetical protein
MKSCNIVANNLPGMLLTLESRPSLRAPTLIQINAAIDSLTPHGGPGFMDITGPNRDYIQIAGGDGVFACEWRQYGGSVFQHWVAGLPGDVSVNDVRIPTNGFYVTVKQHERLSVSDVKAPVSAFVAGSERPITYAWRDITRRFE